jgi:hypothetical protein
MSFLGSVAAWLIQAWYRTSMPRCRITIVVMLFLGAPIGVGAGALKWLGYDFPQIMANMACLVGVCVLIGLLTYLAIRFHENHWRTSAHRLWKRNNREYQDSLHARIDKASLQCDKCSSTALPILNSRNRYRCSKCGLEFAGEEHLLIDFEEYQRMHPDPANLPYPLTP